MGLIVAGPFRAAWKRPSSNTPARPGFAALLPMILSLTFTLSSITLISQFAHPFVRLWPASGQQDPFSYQALAVVSILLQTIILMGLVLLAIRRWTLPFGTLTLIFTLNITALSFMQDHYILIPVAALAGFVADVLLWWLKPSVTRSNELRLFAFLVPLVLYLLYFLTLIFTTDIACTIPLWLGSTVVAGIAGWFLSYLLVPPQMPAEV